MDNHPPGRKLSTLSLVIPLFNEEEVLAEFRNQLEKLTNTLSPRVEIICVNDGSTDGTEKLLNKWTEENSAVKSISLSRNFGQQAAITAGLDAASGEAVVTMDGDLQDPPELIAKFIDAFELGYDVVYAKRVQRHGESFLKQTTAQLFYRWMRICANDRMPLDVGEFRLMSRLAVDAVIAMRERHRFLRGMSAWTGFSQLAIEYDRPARAAGETKFTFNKMFCLSTDAMFSFSTLPLRFSMVLGIIMIVFALCYASYAIARTLFVGDTVRGWTTLVDLILMMGGTILVSLGIIGEYVARIYEEVKRRPIYVIREKRNF